MCEVNKQLYVCVHCVMWIFSGKVPFHGIRNGVLNVPKNFVYYVKWNVVEKIGDARSHIECVMCIRFKFMKRKRALARTLQRE